MKICPTCGEQFGDGAERCAKDQTPLIRVKDASAERDQAMIGRTIDKRYVITERLGAGGMGTVYFAQQTAVGRKVALKVLPAAIADDLAAVKRFMQEAKAASTLSHPNTITIHDFGQTEDGQLYLVMEFVEGDTLAKVIKVGGAMHSERAARVTLQILSALEDAHARSIVHRDLKPENVIISPRPGNPDFVKVLDFGLAKVAEDGSGEGLTKTGQVFGTPAYMSPEQARGERCDLRTDLYAVGVMLYEMLAGRRPFDGETPISILVKHINEMPPRFETLPKPSDVPPALQNVVFTSMAKAREDRYASATEMRAALEAALGGRIDLLMSGGGHPALIMSKPPANVGIDETLAPSDANLASVRSLRAVSQSPQQPGSIPSGFHGQMSGASLPRVDSLPPTQGGSRMGVIVGGAVAALGLGAAGLFVFLQDEPQAPPVAAAAQPAPAATAPPAPTSTAAKTASVRVEATPLTAQASIAVTLDGKSEPARLLGTLPGAVEVPLGARINITFSAPEHVSLERTLLVDGPVTVSVGLVPAPPPSAAPAVASAAQSPPKPAPPSMVATNAPAPRPNAPPKPAAPATAAAAASGLDDLK